MRDLTPIPDDFTQPIEYNGRRGFTGIQLASSPTLRAFVKNNPDLFERAINLDVVFIREPRHWADLGSLPFQPPRDQAHRQQIPAPAKRLTHNRN
jgi:hypothetical protein